MRRSRGPSAGQPPEQEAVDRPERQFAPVGAGTDTIDIVQDPFEFRPREIRIEDQPSALTDQRLVAVSLQFRTQLGSTAILPDDRVVDGFSGLAVPDNHRLALVGDADRRDLAAVGVGCLFQRGDGIAPDILGIMLDPAGLRVMLREFASHRLARDAVGAERHAPSRSRALVDCQDDGVGHALLSFVSTGIIAGRRRACRAAGMVESADAGGHLR